MNGLSQKLASKSAASVGFLICSVMVSWAFVQFAQHPLSYTDLWGHLAYGRYYDTKGEFPDREPFLSTTTNHKFIATPWLSQWGGYKIHEASGAVGLQLTYAVLVAGSILCFLRLIKRQSRSWTLAILGAIWFVILEQQQLVTIRPQLTGVICFLLFLNLVNLRRKLTLLQLGSLSALMVFWANAHGSFAIAPVILIIALSGHVFDVLRIHRRRETPLSQSIHFLRSDRFVLRSLGVLGIIFITTFINPYGWRLWVEVLTFGKSPNLYDLIEWMPLWKTPKQGTVFLLSGFALLAIFLVRQYRLRLQLWLPVFALTVQVIRVSRYFVWWSPMIVKAVIPDWRLAERWKRYSRVYAYLERGLNYSLPGGMIGVGIASGIALSMTPWSDAMFRGESWSPRSSYAYSTPIEVAKPLIELAPESLMFNTMEWGDWLIWESEGTLPVFVNSHVHSIKEEVWRDYMAFLRQSDGWKERWDSYSFTVAVIQYQRHRKLADSLAEDPEWVEIYKKRGAKIFVFEPTGETNNSDDRP